MAVHSSGEKQQAAVVRQTHMDKGGFDISRRSVYADFNLTDSDVKVTSHNRNESPINSACDSHSVWPFTPDIGITVCNCMRVPFLDHMDRRLPEWPE